jgi:hypothetical protein
MGTPDSTAVPAGMPFLFRNLRRTDPPPATGECHVAPPHQGDRCLARLVLDRGPEAMPCGAKPITTIVIKADPTLDDMLAATIVAVQIGDKPLPAGLRPFVEYAAVVRQGLSPGTTVPLERSLAGLYKAMRWKHGDLTEADHGRRFADDWNRLAAVVFAHAADGLDPFVEFPLPSWLFGDDQRFLTGDRDLYLRDKLAGETWTVVIPDEGPAAMRRPALLLRRPQSRLWKEWARSDAAAPRSKSLLATSGSEAAAGFDFLAVDELGSGNWVFSTNPVQRVPIRSLRDLLQKEEEARAPGRAAEDPWVSLFDDTLVAAPHAGTAISETDLLRLVKKWARARPTRRRTLPRGVPVALGGIVLIALLGARWAGAAPPQEPVVVSVAQEGKPTQYIRVVPDADSARSPKVDAFVEPRTEARFEFRLPMKAAQPVLLRLAVTFPDGGQALGNPVELTVNDQSLGESTPMTGGPGRATLEPRSAYLRAGENIVGVRFVNDRAEEVRAQVRVAWDEDPKYRPDLYVLAVGTRRYRSQPELPLAEKDAADMVQALRRQEGAAGPFRKVWVVKDGPLLNPTREQLLEALAGLKRKATEGSVAWIAISGHGVVSADERFYLVLSGKDGADEKVPWDEVYAAIDQVRCPVVVLLDTCSSGEIHTDLGTRARLAFGKHSPSGRVLFSASFGRAHEADDWGNSALCLAAIECLRGERLYQKVARPDLDVYVQSRGDRREVTLENFQRYLKDRVHELYNARGGANPASRVDESHTPALNLATITVAERP